MKAKRLFRFLPNEQLPCLLISISTKNQIIYERYLHQEFFIIPGRSKRFFYIISLAILVMEYPVFFVTGIIFDWEKEGNNGSVEILNF